MEFYLLVPFAQRMSCKSLLKPLAKGSLSIRDPTHIESTRSRNSHDSSSSMPRTNTLQRKRNGPRIALRKILLQWRYGTETVTMLGCTYMQVETGTLRQLFAHTCEAVSATQGSSFGKTNCSIETLLFKFSTLSFREGIGPNKFTPGTSTD